MDDSAIYELNWDVFQVRLIFNWNFTSSLVEKKQLFEIFFN